MRSAQDHWVRTEFPACYSGRAGCGQAWLGVALAERGPGHGSGSARAAFLAACVATRQAGRQAGRCVERQFASHRMACLRGEAGFEADLRLPSTLHVPLRPGRAKMTTTWHVSAPSPRGGRTVEALGTRRGRERTIHTVRVCTRPCTCSSKQLISSSLISTRRTSSIAMRVQSTLPRTCADRSHDS
ncbi:hypothetical protein P171DRAFT_149261 [Karstenula rhodostoma CBS 690.94]|uniref:Uncharacterized protein n=1 Tax=Karstenula rhodostoma CBS 690.94 TaxID=1392251 RepID=A0A9P4UI76_9PLEO|nr:hypothetical protein P171DRAFT_149261 [Karstenula rhodostoma CBS 690.94]